LDSNTTCEKGFVGGSNGRKNSQQHRVTQPRQESENIMRLTTKIQVECEVDKKASNPRYVLEQAQGKIALAIRDAFEHPRATGTITGVKLGSTKVTLIESDIS